MGSNNEYEQQQFWKEENPLDIMIKYQKLYDIITYNINQQLMKHIDPNRSYLPKEYTNGK